MQSISQSLAGWGNAPHVACNVYRPDRSAALRALVEQAGDTTFISRGLGRSYGDPAINEEAGVVDHTQLNRFVEFNPLTGVVVAQAGLSMDDLIAVVLPHGWFPPVTPGTRFVTLGGALAADVHGKNHHTQGAFNSCVTSFDLLTATGEVLTCSRSQHAEVFWASLGAMGLTGFILTLSLQLLRVESARMDVTTTRVKNLWAMLDHFEQTDESHPYSVAWIDCLARGEELGRGVVLQGTHATGDGEEDLRLPVRSMKTVPMNFPGIALNAATVGAFNALYYRRHPTGTSVESYDKFFYPLDAVHHWYRIYGRRGFVQYQPIFPTDSGAAGVRQVLERLVDSRRSSFLAVLKRMGGQDVGPLGFPMAGLTLAVDLPRSPGIESFLQELDAIVLDHGGRLYLAKDACMTAATFERMYPRLNEFQAVRCRLDPAGLLGSNQARRLGIV